MERRIACEPLGFPAYIAPPVLTAVCVPIEDRIVSVNHNPPLKDISGTG